VRIVAGRLGGRRLPVPARPGLRPTPERTRETLFNWLRDAVDGARVLDLFAGSGALAFEALSRGAAEAVLVERDARACASLAAVARDLGVADVARVVRGTLPGQLERLADQAPFDLVFLDPPFDAGLAGPTLDALASSALLAPDALVYCEWPAQAPAPADGRFEVRRETRAGDSRAAVLARVPER
jgi:16S rRNA (guanine966-N2)-methyltransferase